MKRKPFGILRHALTMVRRNLRSYAMLSVTIILSFSILLGFMGYMDSEHYNQYKIPLGRDPSLLRVSTYELSAARANVLQERAAEYGTTHSVQYFVTPSMQLSTDGWSLATGEPFGYSSLDAQIYFVPKECWFIDKTYYYDTGERGVLDPYEVTWLDERETNNVTLQPNEIIMDEQLFKALGLSRENSTLTLDVYGGADYSWVEGAFTVVGTVPSPAPLEVETYKEPVSGEIKARVNSTAPHTDGYNAVLIFPTDVLNRESMRQAQMNRTIIFYSDQPESVRQLIKTLEPGIFVISVYESHESALEVIRTEKATKSLIAILLLLILGINLYSSFQNALNERKFEIGVKRAVGASAFSIVRQFFYESMLVMLSNIAVTVAVVVDIGLVLKLYREANAITYTAEGHIRRNRNYMDYVLYITGESVAMFAVCALVLTVVFSFIFAYKATRVQIVDYLKAE
ncbi:MAG: ABC transporter permease [Oscillospiraceae bacterium]|nr:ABC transporter permease [Oscillospiraceae bacterium]